jgi:hypothetical protein
VLYLPYQAGQIAALRGLIATWMRLAIFETMNRKEGDQRLWFIIDELDALGQIDGLKDALARLRKFGGRCVLGFQSIAQVRGTYGDAEAQTILRTCAVTVSLRTCRLQAARVISNSHAFFSLPVGALPSRRLITSRKPPVVTGGKGSPGADRGWWLDLDSFSQRFSHSSLPSGASSLPLRQSIWRQTQGDGRPRLAGLWSPARL